MSPCGTVALLARTPDESALRASRSVMALVEVMTPERPEPSPVAESFVPRAAVTVERSILPVDSEVSHAGLA